MNIGESNIHLLSIYILLFSNKHTGSLAIRNKNTHTHIHPEIYFIFSIISRFHSLNWRDTVVSFPTPISKS